MAGRTRSMLSAAALPAVTLLLAGCATAGAAGSTVGITDWLDDQGAKCSSGGGYEAVTVSAVPFTRVSCQGVQVDMFDSGATTRYDAFLAADCSATPEDQRAGMDDVVVVRGDGWVIRGDATPTGGWPESVVGAAGVTPSAAAAALNGQEQTVGQVCRDLGAWPA